jgi:drug/metabolite transporter (DMT)-like permease
VTRLPDSAAGLGIIPVAAAWGSSFIFIRVALPALGTFGVAEARALLGSLAVTGLVFARGRRLRFGQGLARYTVLGALASAAPYILMCYATEEQGAALTAVFFATVPLFSAGIEAVWFRRRPALSTLTGLAAGFAGVVLIVGGDSTGLSTRAVVADAAALGAAVFSALGANYSRRHFAGEDPFTQTAGQSATAAVLMIPVVIAAPPHHAPTLTEVGSLLALAVVCTALAYTLFFWLVARLGPTRALTSELLVPAFAALWSWLAFGERLPGTALGGAALILGGSALAMGWARRRGVRTAGASP